MRGWMGMPAELLLALSQFEEIDGVKKGAAKTEGKRVMRDLSLFLPPDESERVGMENCGSVEMREGKGKVRKLGNEVQRPLKKGPS